MMDFYLFQQQVKGFQRRVFDCANNASGDPTRALEITYQVTLAINLNYENLYLEGDLTVAVDALTGYFMWSPEPIENPSIHELKILAQ